MDIPDVQTLLLQHHGLRVEPEMARYVLQQAQRRDPPDAIAVIGGDARTGRPLRCLIDPDELLDPQTPTSDSP